jgi:hypothetical protein
MVIILLEVTPKYNYQKKKKKIKRRTGKKQHKQDFFSTMSQSLEREKEQMIDRMYPYRKEMIGPFITKRKN